MKFIEYAQKLETFKYLAEYKRTGTASQLATKLQFQNVPYNECCNNSANMDIL